MHLWFFFAASFSLFKSVFSNAYEYPDYDAHVKKMSDKLTGDYSAFHLKNGLVVFHVHDNANAPFSLALSVGVGSSGVSEKQPILTQQISGLAHLLEHSIFCASSQFPTLYGFSKFIELQKGYSNASTDRDKTVYELQIPHGNHIFEALGRFGYMFISPIFPAECVQAQRDIVHNEW